MPENPTGTTMSGTRNRTGRSLPARNWSALPNLPAGITVAATRPVHSACGWITASRSVWRSPWPASSDRPLATPGSAAQSYPPANLAAYADTVAARQRPAVFTVLRATPITRAISKIAMPFARRNRQISAQFSMSSTCFLPSSDRARVSGKLVNFRSPRGGHFSVAVESRVLASVADHGQGGPGEQGPCLVTAMVTRRCATE
jgi:hypothetical protein